MPERFSVSPGRPSPLGVTVEDGGINLAVVSRNAERIFISIFDQSGDRELARLILPGRTDDEIHHGFIAGVKAGARYGLRADGPFAPTRGHRYDPAKLLADPYAVQLDRPFVQHPDLAAPRALEIDTAWLVPKAIVSSPQPLASSLSPRPPGFIYEIAVKAFTKQHPDIAAPLRGTVAALAHPRVVDHLLKLGVDTVELMPIAAWIDERHLPALKLTNAWGYNPVTFMAPDPRIAPDGLAGIRRAVGALHNAGIRVLLDVVMNHTGESDADGATLSLRGLDNALYYRHAEQDPGLLMNDTGCGNTLAVDRAPVARLVLDALRHWASQTGVDGFRFDLATVLGRTSQGFSADAPLFSAIDRDPLLAGLTLIAEPWDVGPDGHRLGQFPARWHEWNDRYRDDVRRFWRGRDGSMGALATRLAGSSDVFAARSRPPSRSINFVAAHDGFTLYDLVSYRSKHNLPNGEDNRDGSSDDVSWNNGAEGPTADAAVGAQRHRDVRALLTTLMVSRGTPMLTAGDEFERTQRGNNNAYAQDNETTWLDWENADDQLIEFVSRLAELRRSHRALSDDRFLAGAAIDESGIPDALWLTSDGREMSAHDWNQSSAPVLGLALYAAPTGALPADRICIWVNRGLTDMAAALPEPRPGHDWRIVLDSSKSGNDIGNDPSGNRIAVPARAVVVVAEAADTRPRRPAKADDDLIDRLAAAAGIQPEWWQLDGTHHRVTPETKRDLLKAMRLPAQTASEATAMLIDLQRAQDVRSLPASALLAADSPAALRLAVPGQDGDAAICLSVKLEDGGTRRLQFARQELQEIGRVTIAGETVRHLALPLPALPPGYHTVVLEEEPAQECRLIVSPPTCFLDGAIAGGAKLFGLTSHLYSLRHDRDAGIGDFETLSQFCEATARLGGSAAGVNPLHHLFPTDRERASPYQPSDRRFIDPIYIDLAGLDALVHSPRLRAVLAEADSTLHRLGELTYIDYPGVWNMKRAALAAAYADFEISRGSPATAQLWKEFSGYRKAEGNRLQQHAVYETLADKVGTVDLGRWPAEWRSPAGGAVEAFVATDPQAADFRIWLQWIADGQFATAAARARSAGLALGIYRDLALGTALDGGEIWANPEQFAQGVSLGAPPDPFARDGQVWQLAPFEPHALRHSGYDPFIAMLAANMRHAGMLRIDHILGYSRQFWVPQGSPGKDGAYVNFPLDVLLAITAIESRRARCTIIGEDLGTVPEGLRERLAAADILSYRVLWFEKDGESFRPPERYPPLSVSCLSSHDLPTFVGWRRGRDIEIDRATGRLGADLVATRRESRRREEQSLRDAIRLAGLPAGENDDDLMTAAHELLAQSPSALVLVQADDLGEETEPLNVPGTDRERPNWRRRQGGTIADLPRREVTARVVAAVKRGRNKIA
jgi:glycogen debranching enzyme GlgX/4-alpha-glucanotransferase